MIPIIIGLTIYITAITTLAITQVGETPTNFGPYNWTLPLKIFILIVFPAVLGFFIGRESEK